MDMIDTAVPRALALAVSLTAFTIIAGAIAGPIFHSEIAKYLAFSLLFDFGLLAGISLVAVCASTR